MEASFLVSRNGVWHITKTFDIYYDTSWQRLGCVLMQKRKSGLICISLVEKVWRKLSNSRPGVSRSCACSQDMETLYHRSSLWDIKWSQEPQIHFHSDRSKFETTKMARIDQRLWYRNQLSSWQSECSSRHVESQEVLQCHFCLKDATWIAQRNQIS
jgi:hypothetical protein